MKNTLIILLFFCSFSAKSQLLNADELYNKVVLLSDISRNIIHTGTGFLLTSENQYFLITAKHVADLLKIETSEIFFKGLNPKAIGFKLKNFLSKQIVSGFNDQSDFFILKLEPFDSISSETLKKSSLDSDMLANNRESIDRKMDVLVMGYPIFDLDNFSPITFKSYFSSALLNIKIKDLTKPCFCYLLENPSMAGFSGGPVFVGVKDRASAQLVKTLIIGIVTGTTFDNTGGKFAIITPAFHLLDLVNRKTGH
jgi:hypothetical protein